MISLIDSKVYTVCLPVHKPCPKGYSLRLRVIFCEQFSRSLRDVELEHWSILRRVRWRVDMFNIKQYHKTKSNDEL